MQTQLNIFERELKIRNYSARTVRSYLYGLREYFSFKKGGLINLNPENIRNFLLHCEQKQTFPQSRNLFLSAIKFYYQNVLNNQQKIDIQSAKKPKSLPFILSRAEIRKILKSPRNTKYSLLLSLAYGSGMRVSEITELRVQDLGFEELTVHIRKSKGQKDRISIIPKILVNNLKCLIARKTKNDFVFASERGGKLTTRTAQKIFKNALHSSDIKKVRPFILLGILSQHIYSKTAQMCAIYKSFWGIKTSEQLKDTHK